jgi:hypothetical protein
MALARALAAASRRAALSRDIRAAAARSASVGARRPGAAGPAGGAEGVAGTACAAGPGAGEAPGVAAAGAGFDAFGDDGRRAANRSAPTLPSTSSPGFMRARLGSWGVAAAAGWDAPARVAWMRFGPAAGACAGALASGEARDGSGAEPAFGVDSHATANATAADAYIVRKILDTSGLWGMMGMHSIHPAFKESVTI